MKIRAWQIREMGDRAQEEYIEKLARHVESRFPSEVATRGLTGPPLRATLRKAVSQAREYGVTDAVDLESYSDCVVLLGPDFDRDHSCAWAGTILGSNDISGSSKMNAISEHLLFGANAGR